VERKFKNLQANTIYLGELKEQAGGQYIRPATSFHNLSLTHTQLLVVQIAHYRLQKIF
jgi:hypothetical protein